MSIPLLSCSPGSTHSSSLFPAQMALRGGIVNRAHGLDVGHGTVVTVQLLTCIRVNVYDSSASHAMLTERQSASGESNP
jgi:hypothetical protein